MATGWPFSTPRQWDFEYKIAVAPTTKTPIVSYAAWVGGIKLSNPTLLDIKVTFTENSLRVVDVRTVKAGDSFPLQGVDLEDVAGLSHECDQAGLSIHAWGWKQ